MTENTAELIEPSHVVLTDGVFSGKLGCFWRSWRVIGPCSLAVDMPPDSCTDMAGAIRVAKALMPNVREIHSFCDGIADTKYFCVGGKWSAFRVSQCP